MVAEIDSNTISPFLPFHSARVLVCLPHTTEVLNEARNRLEMGSKLSA